MPQNEQNFHFLSRAAVWGGENEWMLNDLFEEGEALLVWFVCGGICLECNAGLGMFYWKRGTR